MWTLAGASTEYTVAAREDRVDLDLIRRMRTPVARSPSNMIRSTSASVISVRFPRFSAGLRKACAAESRRPAL